MAIDKLIIEIDGDASGLSKAILSVTNNLKNFDKSITSGNRSVNSFIATLNKGAGGLTKLAGAVAALKGELGTLRASVASTDRAIGKLGTQAKGTAGDLRAFSSALNSAEKRMASFSANTKGANSSITSLNRRIQALASTVSLLNSNLRTVNTTVSRTGTSMGATATAANRAAVATTRAGQAAGGAATFFNRLNKSNISLMEGFRRHVAQITALRTLVYQGIFWFSPLLYSVIKVNSAYEKQMQLLKNLSGQSTELAKTQWATNTRNELVKLANTNPFSLEKITETFVRMKVSGLDPLNGSMQALMDSIAAFGGSDEQLDRSAIAIQQMVGKSAVSMEELRQQIGEHIPDAMKSMAIGMGLSMADFYDAVKKGTVESKAAISKMLAVLNDEHRGAAKNMMNTWSGLMARLGTAWQNFIAKLTRDTGGNSFIATLKKQVQELLVFLNTPAGVNFAIEIQNSIVAVTKAIVSVIKFVYEFRHAIILVAKAVAGYWTAKLFLGVIGLLGSGIMKVITVCRNLIVVYRLLTGATNAAAAASFIFGRNTAAAAVATRALGGAASAGSSALAALASRFGIVAMAAVAAAAAIWLVVRALNAKTNAQINSEQAADVRAGGTWKEGEKQAEYKRLSELKAKAESKGYFVGGTFIPYTKAQRAQWGREYQEGAKNYNAKSDNTARAINTSEQMHYGDVYGTDPYAKIRANAGTQKEGVTDGAKLQSIQKAENKALQDAALADIARLRNDRKNAPNANARAAIDAKILERQGDYESFVAGANALNADNKFIDAGGDKKKKNGGAKRDPLERYRNKFETAFVNTAQAEHDYNDLVNGESTVFDEEAAQAEAERQASLLKTEDALKKATAAEHMRQEEIKKSVKVQEAIIKLQDARADIEAQTAEAVDELSLSYESINMQSKHYAESLAREYRNELAIIESRIANEKATKDEVRQYVQLREAINAVVRAKEAELVVQKAKEAKSANEDYYAKFRTPNQQADYLGNLQLQEYSEALAKAQSLAAGPKASDEELLAAKGRLVGLTKEQIEASKEEIIITANKTVQDDAATRAAEAAIPFLQERLRILKEESEIRNKLGGAGGALFDWANQASLAFNNLGEAMGSTITGALDDMVNGLMEGKMAFKDFAKTILKELIRIIIRALIAKAILSALGLGGSGGGGAMSEDGSILTGDAVLDNSGIYDVPVNHSGAIAGGFSGVSRSVDPALFNFAQRYHSGGIAGLRKDEVPIIAQKGEGIFTQEQMAALGKQQPNNVQINVINESGTPVEAEHTGSKFDGEKWVETVVLKKMGKPGPIRESLRSMQKR